ncbi:hypothetical protein [Streptomyces sp. NBC_01006]|uniref:hypothetical protein n=1 Tax=Streptomyces sp. NBC_01006 TaxID=2903716 RepID=UPI0038648783|nr:hypothetical protein OG509_00205 [Streptomyces sp. NBC_01006]
MLREDIVALGGVFRIRPGAKRFSLMIIKHRMLCMTMTRVITQQAIGGSDVLELAEIPLP